MIFDLNQIPDPPSPHDYDVCIAGGGVAGITLATRLAARGRRVALLEAGEFEYSDESQESYEGQIVGRSYFDLDTARLRYLGGTSNHWAGYCRPLDAYDFERRSYIPHSGWPFAKAEIDPYLDAACRILEIEAKFPVRDIPDSDDTLVQVEFQQSPPVRFGDKYRDELRDSTRIDVFLNANLVDIRLHEDTGDVSGFQCANYVDRTPRHTFAGKAFVLALGGIENPRLLLNCRDQVAGGIGNDKDLVGRFFMDHFKVHGGFYIANRSVWPFADERVYLTPSSALMDSQGIANVGLRMHPIREEPSLWDIFDAPKHHAKRIICANDIIRDFLQSIESFRCPADLPPIDGAGILRVEGEQVPNGKSRVHLAEETDRFGLRRVALDWQTTDVDQRTIKLVMMAFGRYLASHEYGSVKLADWVLDDDLPIPGVAEDSWLGAGWHHMGTTRMATAAEEGVVDPNCRVFGVGNLYIAGSSVFPTGGYTNPTLTIVQLTLRLCDHLDRILAT